MVAGGPEGENRELRHYQSTSQNARSARVWQQKRQNPRAQALCYLWKASLLLLRLINS